MARTVIPLTTLTANTAVADPTNGGTAIDATNNHYINLGNVPLEEVVIRVTNTTASTKTVVVKAGDNPPADAAGQGDSGSLSLTDGSTTPTRGWFGPLTSARFVQSDGTVNIDVAASMTGFIAVFQIPRTA